MTGLHTAATSIAQTIIDASGPLAVVASVLDIDALKSGVATHTTGTARQLVTSAAKVAQFSIDAHDHLATVAGLLGLG